MKIGILTYHFGTNFGGQLQCYALSKTLEAMGHDVEIINYLPSTRKPSLIEDIRHGLRVLKNNFSVNGVITAYNTIVKSSAMRKNFEKFQKENLNIGKQCSLQDFTEKYSHLDLIVTGSDQVWAPAHHKTGAYFFNFSPEFNGKKISYAPCCAINKVEPQYKEQLSNLLSKFDAISVRNQETHDFVKALTGKDVPIVADPTFLYPFNKFTSARLPKGEYAVVYILGDEIVGGHKKIIEKINNEKPGMPVCVMSLTNSKPHYFSWADKTYWDLNPTDWVAFIKNASLLYTDSFHGVVFALKFHTPFIAYYKEGLRASRFIDLKNRFALNNIICNTNELNGKTLNTVQPEFAKTDAISNKLIETSKCYLNTALK